MYSLFYSIDVNINIAEDENEEEIIEKRRKQREELLKVIFCLFYCYLGLELDDLTIFKKCTKKRFKITLNWMVFNDLKFLMLWYCCSLLVVNL